MVSHVYMITCAYEQGVGKGHQAFNRKAEIANPYTDSECNEAWRLGYKEGKAQAERLKQAEPVAWMWSSGGHRSSLTFGGPNSNTPEDWDVLPLYTHPHATLQLTDEQIDSVWVNTPRAGNVPSIRDFARAILNLARSQGC